MSLMDQQEYPLSMHWSKKGWTTNKILQMREDNLDPSVATPLYAAICRVLNQLLIF